MKLRIVMLAVLLVGTGTLSAQLKTGIKGGINFADISSFNGDNRISGHAGILLHKTINNRWCIQPELLFSGQGQRYQTIDGERTLALNYIQVPLMFQYYATKQLYVEFGPQVAFLLSANIKGDGGFKQEVDNQYNKADFSLNFGAGIAATPKFGFYGRYMAGLTDITRHDQASFYNRGGQVGIYYIVQ